MKTKWVIVALLALIGLLLAGCRGLGLYDKSQEPVITVAKGLQPVIAWTPDQAYELNVYEGSEDGDGLGSIWNAKMGDGYENSLKSPVTYGVPPEGSEVRAADPLEAGKTYTVVIHRKDPNRSGDGFTSTGHRYIGKATFTAEVE